MYKSIVVFILLFNSISSAQIIPKELTLCDSVKYVTTFDGFLNYCIDGDFSQKNELFILNAGENEILVADKNYFAKRLTGGKGQGPGEFFFRKGVVNTGFISLDNDTNIYVLDNQNFRIQKFSLEGHLIHTFAISTTMHGMVVDSKGNIYTIGSGKTTGMLVFMYDKNGKFIKQFGKALLPEPKSSFDNVMKIAINSDDEIMLFSVRWPVLKIFDKRQNLKVECTLKSPVKSNSYLTKAFTINPGLDKVRNNSNLKIKSSPFKAACSFGKDFFILVRKEYILKVNNIGNVVGLYHYDAMPPFQSWAAASFEKNDDEFVLFFDDCIYILRSLLSG